MANHRALPIQTDLMSRKDRRAPQLRRRTKPTVSEAPEARLQMSVVTSPQSMPDGRPSLHGDVNLVKSAILYADEVELLGLAASLVYATGMAPGAAEPKLGELMELTQIVSDQVVLTPEIRRTIAFLERADRRGTALPDHLREHLKKVRSFTTHAGELLATASSDIVRDTGILELQPALDAKIVAVTDLGLSRSDTIRAATGQSLGSTGEVRAWMDQILKRLQDSRTQLLFDREAGQFVDAMVREGEVELSRTGRLLLGRAATGAGLVARLPAFPEAKVDELLQLRDDLADPLSRYRAAVVRISKTIPDIPVAELDDAVQMEWAANVGPALDDIGNGFLEHGLVRELSRHVRLDTASYLAMASGLFVGVDQFTDLNRVVAGMVSAIPPVGGSLARASLTRGDARRALRRHDFYYLYSANAEVRRR